MQEKGGVHTISFPNGSSIDFKEQEKAPLPKIQWNSKAPKTKNTPCTSTKRLKNTPIPHQRTADS